MQTEGPGSQVPAKSTDLSHITTFKGCFSVFMAEILLWSILAGTCFSGRCQEVRLTNRQQRVAPGDLQAIF